MGSKAIFCRSLGLDHEKVAWLNLSSTFPIENRPILLTTIGSMSKNNRASTLPAFLRFTEKILTRHNDTKGIIHVASYELGQIVYDAFLDTEHADRLIFPKSAEDRDACFEKHIHSPDPTIIISPSMTEGFDFVEDCARWQIIAKVPFGYLGDKQVLGKKELDPQWYDLEAVKSIIQASGRICRSDTDTGVTYILDSDFLQLYSKNEDMFPKWWKDACVWPKRKSAP
jgi:Rad3-related DNA helicase